MKKSDDFNEPELLKKILAELEKLNANTPKQAGRGPEAFEYVDTAEVCQLLKITDRTLSEWRSKNTLPYSKVHGKIYFRLSDIKKMVEDKFNRKLYE